MSWLSASDQRPDARFEQISGDDSVVEVGGSVVGIAVVYNIVALSELSHDFRSV